MPSTYGHSTPTDRGLLFSSTAVLANNFALSSVLDNTGTKDTLLDLEVAISVAISPGVNPYVELRLLYSRDGVAFETSEASDRVDIIPLATGTITRFIRGVHIDPYFLRLYAFNASAVDINITARALTRRMQFDP